MCDQHNNHKELPNGTALEHGHEHTMAHERSTRRSFLRTLGLMGSGSMLLGGFPVQAAASALSNALAGGTDGRILVLIRLNGGNDGLNMVVPLFDYNTYQSRRGTIAIPETGTFKLSDRIGMPNTMESLNPLWQEGKMKVVHSVGYENQNLSHFRSSDIWASASDPNVVDSSGFLGRYILDCFPDIDTTPPDYPPAIQIGGFGVLTFNDENSVSRSFAVSSPEELEQIATLRQLYSLDGLSDCVYGDQLGFLRAKTNETFRYAEVIADAYEVGKNDVAYGNGQLQAQLAVVARLIKGGMGTSLYMVTLDGFDTHVNQAGLHPALMQELATAVKLFYDDLTIGEASQDVLTMTFSEFGRRPEENISRGTDHGAASPLLIFGDGLNGSGFVGEEPNLSDLDGSGNIKYDIDFRSVYATVLESWLCMDPLAVDSVMGQSFERLNLGLSCQTTSVFQPTYQALDHEVLYNKNGTATIKVDLEQSAYLQIEVFDIIGQPIEKLVSASVGSGPHQYTFKRPASSLPGAIYVYRIRANNNHASGKIRLINRY